MTLMKILSGETTFLVFITLIFASITDNNDQDSVMNIKTKEYLGDIYSKTTL